MSIHSMRLRLGMWLSNLRLAKKEKGLIRHNKNILLNSNNNLKMNKNNTFENAGKKIVEKTSLKNEMKLEKSEKPKKIVSNDEGIITILPGECIINQGEKGNTAFLIISGSLNVEIDKKVVGGMSPGEIFGELSLILGEERKATIRAISGTELLEIDSLFLEEYFLSSKKSINKNNKSTLESQKVMKELSVELSKKKDQKINISRDELDKIFKDETQVIKSLALQLHKRLSQMIANQKKLNTR